MIDTSVFQGKKAAFYTLGCKLNFSETSTFGRMLHEMGQSTFSLGNVYDSTYKDLIENSVCKTVCVSSILETIPACCDCVYQPYCGTCPVVNYAMSGDVLEKHPRSYRCMIYSGILDYLFEKFYEKDKEIVKVLNSWSD